LLKGSGLWVGLHTSRDKVSEVELDMSETWSETRKYSSGLVWSVPVPSGRSSGIWP